jgi:hypothetical protein
MSKPFKPTFLYIKTHNTTGLKYFGKTVSNRKQYRGSGTYWIRHLKKYGNDVSTEIVGYFTDEIWCMLFALEFSIINDIVNSKKWANLMLENGICGGDTFSYKSTEDKLSINEKRRITFNKLSDQEKEEYRKKNSVGVRKFIEENKDKRLVAALQIRDKRKANGNPWHSDTTKDNIGKNSKSGTEAVRKKISQTLIGRKNPEHSIRMKSKTGLDNKNTRIFLIKPPDGIEVQVIGCKKLREFCSENSLAYEQLTKHINKGTISEIIGKRPKPVMLNTIGFEIKEIKNDKFKKV